MRNHRGFALPITLFVDDEGRVAARFLGPITAQVIVDTVTELETRVHEVAPA